MTWTRQRAGWTGRVARTGDFAILLAPRAAAAGLKPEPEAVPVDDGLSA
ncbi:hypothetical protein ABGB18_06935 [Nonomuraea sp. B12E4]